MRRIAIALLFAGCTPAAYPVPSQCGTCAVHGLGAVHEVCVDSALLPIAQEVYEGIKRWDDALCGSPRLSAEMYDGGQPPAKCEYVIERAESTFAWISGETASDTGGFADPEHKTAWLIVDRIPAGLVAAATAHELGHLFGATHASGGAMSATLRESCVTESNQREVNGHGFD